jgi:hypothetical protein
MDTTFVWHGISHETRDMSRYGRKSDFADEVRRHGFYAGDDRFGEKGLFNYIEFKQNTFSL